MEITSRGNYAVQVRRATRLIYYDHSPSPGRMPFFQETERVIVNGGNFVDNSGPDARKGEGIKLLLESYVQREAIHDSDSRGALGCHPGTREEYIRNITSWGNGEWESEKRALLMTGPAGAGKSAIARTCAHKIEAAGHLGASFFFFRPSGWNNPKKFIPTIVYQLTTRYPDYCHCIDAVILGDRLVLEKTMDIQFRELIIKPLQKLSIDGRSIGKGAIIIVDGLDECATVDAQIQIIRLITTSIHEQTTPFLWAFFSRPEPPITSAFSSEIATNISWTLPLTLSGNADNDIEAYLRGSFQMIRAKYNIPPNVAWPAGEDIHRLVSQSGGLFVYSATAIRYIDGLGQGTSGLEERLDAVLQLDSKSTENPFSALDQLYILVMMQIPEGILSNTLALLHLRQSPIMFTHDFVCREVDYTGHRSSEVDTYRSTLGLSCAAFHVAIGNLYSVLRMTKSSSGETQAFRFYHRSFPEFLWDPRKSKQFCINSPVVRECCLGMVIRALGTVAINQDTFFDSFILQAFFTLVEGHEGELGKNILQQISEANWNNLHHLRPNSYQIEFESFIQKIPKDWRPRIVRSSRKKISDLLNKSSVMRFWPVEYEENGYFLGQGDKKVLVVQDGFRNWTLTT